MNMLPMCQIPCKCLHYFSFIKGQATRRAVEIAGGHAAHYHHRVMQDSKPQVVLHCRRPRTRGQSRAWTCCASSTSPPRPPSRTAWTRRRPGRRAASATCSFSTWAAVCAHSRTVTKYHASSISLLLGGRVGVCPAWLTCGARSSLCLTGPWAMLGLRFNHCKLTVAYANAPGPPVARTYTVHSTV